MSNIQWTDVTDNIITVEGGGWWCRMISEGCVNCYAAKLNQNSFFGGNKLAYTGQPPTLQLDIAKIESWASQTKPKRHFVASMTDVFGDWISFGTAVLFLRGMWRAPKQTFQILTKRPDVARKLIAQWLDYDGLKELPPNIWIGTSVENQRRADERIPELLKIPARVRFLSVEPMLEAIDFTPFLVTPVPHRAGYEPVKVRSVDWVIFGGESGSGARMCNVDWIREGVEQCRAAGVAPFVKQLGSDAFEGVAPDRKFYTTLDKKAGDPSEWPEDLRVREFPEVGA